MFARVVSVPSAREEKGGGGGSSGGGSGGKREAKSRVYRSNVEEVYRKCLDVTFDRRRNAFSLFSSPSVSFSVSRSLSLPLLLPSPPLPLSFSSFVGIERESVWSIARCVSRVRVCAAVVTLTARCRARSRSLARHDLHCLFDGGTVLYACESSPFCRRRRKRE